MIRDLRKQTNLTQKAFAEKYQIPLQTLKQWESDPESKSFRTPPAYVVHMLSRLVAADYGKGERNKKGMSRAEYLGRAAEESRNHAKHWLRYLRKELAGDKSRLNKREIRDVLADERLSMFQKVVFQRAMKTGTVTNSTVAALNRHAKPAMLEEIQRRHANA